MTLLTTDYGEIQYVKEDLILFPDGLFGFTDLTKFLLICLDEDDSSLLVLQSVQKTEISFAVINPLLVCPDYSPCLAPEELSFLEAADSGELSYYAICVVKENFLENTINLKCPLAIHPQSLKGMQVILEGSQYDFNHRLGDLLSALHSDGSENRGDEHADT